MLKAIHCGQPVTCNRITKDTIIFNASDFPVLVEKLQLDLHEPPMSQVSIDCIRYSEGTTNITQYMTTGTFVYVILSCLQNFKQNECSVKCMDLTNLRPILENKLFQK